MTSSKETAQRNFAPAMSDDSNKSRKRLLDPMERISEILFGLIMVLTFTCSFSVAEAGRREVHKMLLGALGCNLAWGMIDAVFYLMGCLSEHRARHRRIAGDAQGRGPCRGASHDCRRPAAAAGVRPAGDGIRGDATKADRLPEPPAHPRLAKEDWLAAAGVFLLVFLSTFPVVIPFIFIREPRLALRISNAVAIVMLFMAGYAFGRYSGFRPWKVGLGMVVIGMAMVGVTIVLGG